MTTAAKPKAKVEPRVKKEIQTCVTFQDSSDGTWGEKFKAYPGPQIVKNNEYGEDHDVKAGEVIVIGSCGENYTFLVEDLKTLIKAL